MWVANIYWYLDELSCVLVLRNKPWFNEAVKSMEKIWKTIEKERVTGYEHRAPKKRVKQDLKKLTVIKRDHDNGCSNNDNSNHNDNKKHKKSAEKIKTSPQLEAVKHENDKGLNNGIPIIKVLTENIESIDINADSPIHSDIMDDNFKL